MNNCWCRQVKLELVGNADFQVEVNSLVSSGFNEVKLSAGSNFCSINSMSWSLLSGIHLKYYLFIFYQMVYLIHLSSQVNTQHV